VLKENTAREKQYQEEMMECVTLYETMTLYHKGRDLAAL